MDFTNSLCEVCNPARYLARNWIALHREIGAYSLDRHVFQHLNGGHVYRKGWEWTHCVYGLDQLGAVTADARGLAVGAGRECLIFYFADRIREVVALDLYGNALWSATGGREATEEVIHNTERFNLKAVDLRKIRFANCSGTDIKEPDASFDFCWSMSSIEHFGGHEAAATAMREMARVTRPGGIVAVATEYLLLPEYTHEEFFNQKDIQQYLIDSVPELQLISGVNWDTLTPEYLIDSIAVPQGVDRLRRHVVLNDGAVQWTSVMLFFRKR